MKDDKGGSKRMKDIDFKLLGVLIYDRWTNKRMDICNCRVAFATENFIMCVNVLFLSKTVKQTKLTYNVFNTQSCVRGQIRSFQG